MPLFACACTSACIDYNVHSRVFLAQALVECSQASEVQYKWVRLSAALDNLIQASDLLTTNTPTPPTSTPAPGSTQTASLVTSPSIASAVGTAGAVASRASDAVRGMTSVHLRLALTCHRFCEEGQSVDRRMKSLAARVDTAGGWRWLHACPSTHV